MTSAEFAIWIFVQELRRADLPLLGHQHGLLAVFLLKLRGCGRRTWQLYLHKDESHIWENGFPVQVEGWTGKRKMACAMTGAMGACAVLSVFELTGTRSQLCQIEVTR